MLIRVHRARPKEKIFVFSPGGAVKRDDYLRGINVLKGFGLDVESDKSTLYSNPDWAYLAGTDEDRAAGIRHAIMGGYGSCMAVRGGYGSLRAGVLALKGLDMPNPGPVVMGFSDVTALHALLNRRGMVSFHGPNLAGLGSTNGDTRARALSILAGRAGQAEFSLAGLDRLSGSGVVTARLLGGNLSVWCSMVGTGYLPDARGAILLLEDVNEPAYRIDRMLLQLRLAMNDTPPAAVVFGEVSNDPDTDFVLCDFARHAGVPVVANAPVGHGHLNYPLALNALYSLDPEQGTLKLMEDVYGD